MRKIAKIFVAFSEKLNFNMISKQKFWEQIECAIDTFCIFPYGLWTWKHFLLIMALKVVCTAKVIKKVNPASQSKVEKI